VYCKRKNFQQRAICAIRTLDVRPSIFIRDNPIFSSERIFHKDYDCKGLDKKILFVILKGIGAKTNLLAVNRQSALTLTLT
jgi:hypothetical protein